MAMNVLGHFPNSSTGAKHGEASQFAASVGNEKYFSLYQVIREGVSQGACCDVDQMESAVAVLSMTGHIIIWNIGLGLILRCAILSERIAARQPPLL